MIAFSPDIALADDLVNEINARSANGQWLQALTSPAERTLLPEWSLRGGEGEELRVTVCPWVDPLGQEFERDGQAEYWPIDFTFVQRLQEKTLNECDELMNQVEEIRQFFDYVTMDPGDGRCFSGTGFEYLARYDPSKLNVSRRDGVLRYSGVFLSAFRVPYRLLQ